MSNRIAVDIGGTFTDVVMEHGGKQYSTKLLTTPDRPASGFIAGVEKVMADNSVNPGDVELILHGTTLATNALIERKGASTALITTLGHRDSLDMAYENRFAQYDIDADRLPPLVERDLRLPVKERMNYCGEVLTPLDEATVAALIPKLEQANVQSVAIGLLHAYANPAHEDTVANILARALPETSVSLSSQVCPEIREYERQSTTCANAYVQPMVSRYLADVQSMLGERGFTCPCLLMTSAGSLVTIETAARFPIRLVESGPAGGAILAAHLAQSLNEPSVVSFDMGGTTAKICLIDDGEPVLSREFEIDRAHRFTKGSGMPVKIPVMEMVEIGAGGGSIAHVDNLNRIRVGPQSAGADPGPACYRLGGTNPTVTDANLMLGRLDPQTFAGGQIQLSVSDADRALQTNIGQALEFDSLHSAKGLIEIVDENMASAARVHAAERGKELAGRTMIAFGGAAPLHAARLAQKLQIEKVIIPNSAGVGSAIGFLLAPIAYEVVRSRYMRLDTVDFEQLNRLFDEMETEATEVVRLGAPDDALTIRRHAYARYVGQGYEVKIELPLTAFDDSCAVSIQKAFETVYEAQYGLLIPGSEVEVLTWSVAVSASRGQTLPTDAGSIGTESKNNHESRQLHFPDLSESVKASILNRNSLQLDNAVAGPGIIQEAQTSTIVPQSWQAEVNTDGDLVLRHADKAMQTEQRVELAENVRNQVLWDRLISIVEEQAQTIIRTAFSTTVREAGDLSAGVFDPQGRMLAQAVTGTPGHVNAMAASVGYFLEKYPAKNMQPGDVFVTNDPWLGTGHLFDFTVVTPLFCGGNAVALFACTVHVVDIGGSGFSPDSGQVFEEGLCIPIMPLFEQGKPNDSLFEIIKGNVREPVQVVGDLYSLTASNEIGARRLIALMEEFALADLSSIGDHIINTSRQAMLDAISKLPAGRYENEMTVDGYDNAVRLKASLKIKSDSIVVDYKGTSPVSSFGINVPLTYAQAYTSFGIRCVVGNDIPNNSGSLKPIQVAAPEGSILNAPRPCAVNVRHVIGQMLPDVVLGCLQQAMPGKVPAEGSSSLWNPMLSGGHGMVGEHAYGDATPFSVTIFHSGGTGARPGKNGLSATAFPSGVRNTPVEITESLAPLIFHRKEYRINSGGAGRYRGGDGQVIEIVHSESAPYAVFALFDRIDHPARGRDGGSCGQPGKISLANGTVLKGKGKQIVPAGEKLVLELPGGGGLGKL
ncbi:MAG: hydantoinase B/oxoprolinase family protein [Gammaproteobacteria bacterium]|nr:hydantoinase B/oxoprolinase family protein [Gammaproteobacteria bacterium]